MSPTSDPTPMKADAKGETEHYEMEEPSLAPELTDLQKEIVIVAALSEEEYSLAEKKLVRKIDLRLLPTLFILLVLNYLDRNALASARVQGLETDLGLVGTQFNTAISILFVGYILGQIPSNLILSRVRPSLYLSGFVALWGAVSMATALADNYTHLLVIRFFLGVTESPYFPGALFLLSSWYPKKELAFRTSVLYTGSLLSGAFSGLISAGVQKGMDGLAGLASWKWLFILEGGITILAAFISMFILPDYPATTRWLSLREKAISVYRLEKDTGVRDEETMSLFQSFRAAATDYKLYLLALIIVTKTTAGAVTQFIPTVVATFGMSKVNTLLLTAPPYLLAAVLALVISYTSDRKPERCFHLLTPILFGMVGFIIAVTTTTTAPRYFSLFLMVGGMFGSYNVALAWISSTFARPRAKRAAAYAIINSLGNIAQVWSPYLYDKKYSPRYRVAFATNTVMAAAAVLFCLVLRFCLARENKKMEEREIADREGAETKRIRYVL
ncbi:putative nicotinamide mononucleotide permease [Filobasidium floriforme]|uniref:putative nicotinamide mononucleotide permease n=1 Tax=Filobasidium floriforme TaxID=5210 RepID=UPI001E8E41F4|nr:putative nicotinamide mononucleotide permease [Filobasidium floriforme]KAH8078006.1 putative nicotinamide mononucleotide permease [Filobasidium floriforme]